MLGRRLSDSTSAGSGFDPAKQLIIRLLKTDLPDITNGTSFSRNNNPDLRTIEVLQDPYNFLYMDSTSTTGILLKKYSDNWTGASDYPAYTIKLSTISGAMTSNHDSFTFVIDARAFLTNTSAVLRRIIQTNTTANASPPTHSTANSVAGFGSPSDLIFLATDKNPGETPSSDPFLPVLMGIENLNTNDDFNADMTIEIRRSDI